MRKNEQIEEMPAALLTANEKRLMMRTNSHTGAAAAAAAAAAAEAAFTAACDAHERLATQPPPRSRPVLINYRIPVHYSAITVTEPV